MSRHWAGEESRQGRRLNIACTNPRAHRTAWQSIFGRHLICASCSPPCRPEVVAEMVDLDAELAASVKRSIGNVTNVPSRIRKPKQQKAAG